MTIDVSRLSPNAARVLGDQVPLPLKKAAASGILPGVSPGDLVHVIVALSAHDDPAVSAAAAASLGKLARPIVEGALGSELQTDAVRALAESFGTDGALLPRLLGQKAIDQDTLCVLASRADEMGGELIGTNEALLLRFPAAIEKLYMNKRVRMSTADRLIDLAVRNDIELDFPAFKQAAAAIMEQLIPEPTAERTFDDEQFLEIDQVARELNLGDEEDVCEVDEEGKEQVAKKAIPLFALIQQATVTQKIRMAMLGEAAARLILVRDSNRLVSEAAVKSPRITENEATQISAMRSVSDEVLRIIASNGELVRGYKVKLNLVQNPRTPFTFAARLLPHLRLVDLRGLARNKNVPGAVSKAARQAIEKRS